MAAVLEFSQTAKLPVAESLPIVLPTPEPISSQLVEQYVDYFGADNLVAVVGYGSFWNGTATATSIPDAFGIVRDVGEFHQRNRSRNPGLYGPGGSRLQVWYDRSGLTYLRPTFELGGRTTQVKAPVISEGSFHNLGRGGVEDGEVVRRLQALDLHVQGKLAKYNLRGVTGELPRSVLDTINQARISYMALCLPLLPEQFSLEEAMKKVAQLSYDIDPRPEPRGKTARMVEQDLAGYLQMGQVLADAFAREGLLSQVDDGVYRTEELVYSKPEVQRLMREAWILGWPINYGKNFLSGNPLDSLGYGVLKTLRAMGLDEKAQQINGVAQTYLRGLTEGVARAGAVASVLFSGMADPRDGMK